MPTRCMAPDETRPIVLLADQGETKPLTFHARLLTAPRASRLRAVVMMRRGAALDAGLQRTDPDIAEKEKEAEITAAVGYLAKIENLPEPAATHFGNEITETEKMADFLIHWVSGDTYGELIVQMASTLSESEGKG